MKKILWLSDIHFNGVSTSIKTKELIVSFHSKVQNESIDILVISGDIAKSGGESKHYELFAELIIKPLKEKYSTMKIVCVPGNHDVEWKEAKSKFIESLFEDSHRPEEELQKFKDTIGANYYKKVFQDYANFHKEHANNTASDTFSNLYVDDGIVFISVNSAWLSVGSPINQVEYKTKKVQKINSYEFWRKDEEKDVLIFNELGNQSYGFSLKEIKSEIANLKEKIEKDYSDFVKIFVAHHPPNNWLSWQELYAEGNNMKSDFNKLINDCNVDIVLVGHEHTSLVEGSLLFGKALVLYGGMFLDHHEEKYDDCWFKILEQEETNSKLKIVERLFNYHPADKTWKETIEYNMEYNGWGKIANRVNDLNEIESSNEKKNGDTNEERVEIGQFNNPDFQISSDSELQEILKNNMFTTNTENAIRKLLTLDDEVVFNEIEDGVNRYMKEKNDKHTFVYILNNIDDFFTVKDGYLPENSYLKVLLNDLENHSTNPISDLFIFYTYSVEDQFCSVNSGKLERIVRKKSEYFRDALFRNKSCIEILKNAKFAVRISK